ncbi:MAG: exopolyphosphatase, partial [Burkholderiaceae bacterium]
MDIDKTPNTTGGLLAAVDLGSNSFRLLIGRVDQTEFGDQIRPLDALKEPVRLGAGLRPDGTLDKAAQQRGMQALARFGERLRHFAPETVRAVATNALRVASNANDFLMPAQEALGFPIEVISGREEARLIYLGAAHALPLDETDRLVIDIGGGSTELIIGANDQPKLVESAPIGCVSLSREFFPEGEITEEAIEHARLAARDAIAPYAVAYRRHGWQYAVGTSGTAKSLTQIAEMTIGDSALTRDSLEEIAHILTADGSTNSARIRGLSPDRRPVLPGGLALMLAVFDEFDVRSVRYCHGALRQGALYDLLGRSAGHDMRTITVAQMMERYAIDFQQA